MVTAATPLVRASTLIGRPIVAEDGSASLEVQDLVLAANGYKVDGFTLREPGIFGKRHVATVPMSAVKSIGPDAVIIESGEQVEVDEEDPTVCADVGGTKVITEAGIEIGSIADVVVQTKRGAVQVVLVEIDGNGYLVLPKGTSVAGDAVLVPKGSEDHLVDTPEAAADALADR